MTTQTSATRAQLFMRRCRNHQFLSPSQPTTVRTVSSSHLAPSNFSKPLRPPTSSGEQKEERRLPSHLRASQRLQSFQSQTTTLPPPVTEIARPHIPNGFISFLKYNIFKIPLPPRPITQPPFNVLNNPYKARKSWPPDFRMLNPKQQFHFEKLYRRRLLFRTHAMRYNWNRYTKLLQNTLIIITLLYFLFIADPYEKEGGGTPVDGFRAWFFGKVAGMEGMPRDMREHAAELQVYYRDNWKLQPWNVLKEQAREDAERLALRAKREAGEEVVEQGTTK